MNSGLEAALNGGRQPQRKRWQGWIIGGSVAVAVALCACVIGVIFAPAALSALRSRLGLPGQITALTPSVCPGAKPSDAAPSDKTGQFTVVPLYSESLRYASDATTAPADQRVSIWSRDVLTPYPPMNDIFSESVGGDISKWGPQLGKTDPALFRCIVLDMQQAGMASHLLSVLQVDATQISGPTTTAFIVPWYSATVGGASEEQSLEIPVWEQSPLDRSFTRTMADFPYFDFAVDHEYLEVARYDRLGSVGNAYLTLMDNMVTDGMADQFGAHMTGQPTGDFMSAQQEASVWAQIAPNVNAYANPNQENVMFGDSAMGIPNGAGYQIGDHIVGDYLAKHPGVTFEQLVAMDASVIFNGSGYNG